MSRLATVLAQGVTLLTLLAAPSTGWAQAFSSGPAPAADWYHVGNSLEDLSLAGLATGAVDRVWYSPDGSALYASASGKTFETNDFEKWQNSPAVAPAAPDLSPDGTALPEPGARLKGFNGQRSTMYAFGNFVYRSESGGASWVNVTGYQGRSIIGKSLRDLAVSPRDPNELSVASSAGVFRSLDGGRSWSGLNEGLPNLQALRLLAVPSGDRGAQIEVPGDVALEWQPGEKQAWRQVSNPGLLQEAMVRQGLRVTAFAQSGSTIYQGTQDGRITVIDGTNTIPSYVQNGGRVERFWVDPDDSRIAVAVLGARPENAPAGSVSPHVLHTVNSGASWDNITSNLPDAAVHGVAVSVEGRAIYIASDAGLFYTRTDASLLSLASPWQRLSGLPDQAPVADVMLDSGDNQLWTAVEGYGVYSTLAPHRPGDPRVVSTADLLARAAAPGSLMTVRGEKVSFAQAGDSVVPVLNSTDVESQIQIPYDARGSTLSLSFTPSGGRVTDAVLPLAEASPGILVAPDGSPMLLDAVTQTILDASNPAHSRARIQILATGLGRVKPDWPAGQPAPADDPPTVSAPVTAYLNGSPIEVTRAVLAPNYTGFYLVEVELPKLVNYGPAQLSIVAGGHASNPVRVYIEP